MRKVKLSNRYESEYYINVAAKPPEEGIFKRGDKWEARRIMPIVASWDEYEDREIFLVVRRYYDDEASAKRALYQLNPSLLKLMQALCREE